MDKERQMYELEYPAPSVSASGSTGEGPTLVVALHGYADAGLAVEASADHLKAALESRPLATFNNDELIDYRSRRPAVTLDSHEPLEIDDLDLTIRVARDTSGRSFLLLSGPEPDLRWESFTAAVADLAERFNVSHTICLYAAPMPVPHTRPLVVTGHGNSADLVSRMVRLEGKMMVPGSASLFLENEMNKRGLNVAGFTAHVPHYLAANPYPQATFNLLNSVSATTGLDFPLRALEKDIERTETMLSEQLTDSAEIDQVVHQLEEQYDEYMERYREQNPQAIMPGEQHTPSGDEISEQFERFLADWDASPSSIEDLLSADIHDDEDPQPPQSDDENDAVSEDQEDGGDSGSGVDDDY